MFCTTCDRHYVNRYPTSRCRNHIILEDLEAFLNPEQAVEAFAMLDNNGDGKLVLADIRDAVIKIYKERRNLALSLKVLTPHRCAFSMFQLFGMVIHDSPVG